MVCGSELHVRHHRISRVKARTSRDAPDGNAFRGYRLMSEPEQAPIKFLILEYPPMAVILSEA